MSIERLMKKGGISPEYLVTSHAKEIGEWYVIAFPSNLGYKMDRFIYSANYCVQGVGVLNVDLSLFLTYCKISSVCHYSFYHSKYDGLALGHYLDMHNKEFVTTKKTSVPIIFDFYVFLCDAVTQNCWGWNLYAKNEPNDGYTISSIFGSGKNTNYLSSFSPSIVTFKTTGTLPVALTESVFNYGFDPHYWMANSD